MEFIEKTISGYKFNNFAQFENTKQATNVHFGIPVDGGVTETYIDYSESVDENGDLDFYYFEGDISPVLGFPTEIDVRILLQE